jgi:hypothetical protein
VRCRVWVSGVWVRYTIAPGSAVGGGGAAVAAASNRRVIPDYSCAASAAEFVADR